MVKIDEIGKGLLIDLLLPLAVPDEMTQPKRGKILADIPAGQAFDLAAALVGEYLIGDPLAVRPT